MIIGVSLPFVQTLTGKTAMPICGKLAAPVFCMSSFDVGIVEELAVGQLRAVELVWTVGCFLVQLGNEHVFLSGQF